MYLAKICNSQRQDAAIVSLTAEEATTFEGSAPALRQALAMH